MTEERLRELTDLGEAVLMHMDKDQDYIAHYGRIGMKWYQHIYGEYQGAAKYAAKGANKLTKINTKKQRYADAINKLSSSKVSKILLSKQLKQGKKDVVSMERKAKKIEEIMNEAKSIANKKSGQQDKTESSNKTDESKEITKEDIKTLSKDGWEESKYQFNKNDKSIRSFDKTFNSDDGPYNMSADYNKKEETISDFIKGNNKIADVIAKDGAKIKQEAGGKIYDNLKGYGWFDDNHVTKAEFINGIKLDKDGGVTVDRYKGSRIATVLYSDPQYYIGGHWVVAEIDSKGKVGLVSMDG